MTPKKSMLKLFETQGINLNECKLHYINHINSYLILLKVNKKLRRHAGIRES